MKFSFAHVMIGAAALAFAQEAEAAEQQYGSLELLPKHAQCEARNMKRFFGKDSNLEASRWHPKNSEWTHYEVISGKGDQELSLGWIERKDGLRAAWGLQYRISKNTGTVNEYIARAETLTLLELNKTILVENEAEGGLFDSDYNLFRKIRPDVARRALNEIRIACGPAA